jgi:hypothetical protein
MAQHRTSEVQRGAKSTHIVPLFLFIANHHLSLSFLHRLQNRRDPLLVFAFLAHLFVIVIILSDRERRSVGSQRMTTVAMVAMTRRRTRTL